jgi:hypothetical protein
MSANAVSAPKDWSVETDDEGHGDYTLTWGVETTSALDGPDVALSASGLPIPGASLSALGGNPWAFFNRKGAAKLKKVDALRKYWDVTTIFTTRPARRCTTNAIEDPLLEPHKVKGTFAQTIQELLYDVNGAALVNSAQQRYTGAIVQDTVSTPSVELEMNCSFIDLSWLANYADSYNLATHWGMPARSIKCTTGPWERVLYGTCYFYFIVRFTFELRLPNWDIVVPDEGTRVKVAGSSPARYVQYKDEREENGVTFLNGAGAALASGATLVTKTFQRPKQKDFSAAGWPASLL